MTRLASAQEAYVALMPERENRASAAFVAASAHHIAFLADRVLSPDSESNTYLRSDSISSDISATLLFLIAESTADAMEMAKRINRNVGSAVERELLNAVVALARGQLTQIASRSLPTVEHVGSPTIVACQTLWLRLLEGLQALARQLLGIGDQKDGPSPRLPNERFATVRSLSHAVLDDLGDTLPGISVSAFSGPHHLASLLLSACGDLASSALVNLPPPSGVDVPRWNSVLRHIAKQRPYLWRNHLRAIGEGYLEPGTSSVMSFPTGGGKSTLAELKIATALLRNKKVIYLAPTLALVDQVSTSLKSAFPAAQIEQERIQEAIVSDFSEDALPTISVMTPEKCLALISFAHESFEEVGLLVFDECHLLHPRSLDGDRRSIDAMLALLNFTELVPDADLLLLSAMMKNTDEISGWISSLTSRSCLSLSLDWKPTRQARGCVVYDSKEIKTARKTLRQAYRTRTTATPPVMVKRALKATPLGLFCLNQTWQSTSGDDYSLLQLLEGPTKLSIGKSEDGNWYLTSNRNNVAANIAAGAARARLKTLIFAQTVPTCESTSKQLNELLNDRAVDLLPEEKILRDAIVEDCGGEEHIYCPVKPACASHHSLLLPQERRLHEILFRRADGINCLVATSTLAQGMNLPSEVVIIAGDDRFDASAGRFQQMEAHELLNAAGRAGRAGEAAQGLVVVVPSKIISLDADTGELNQHWFELKGIFAKSDQCLDIEDPIAVVLDQIQDAQLSSNASYLLGRLRVAEDALESVP
jgi:superfamily II DNA/RNA helicase